MSKVFICAAIPNEQAIKEEGAVAVLRDPLIISPKRNHV